MPGFFYSLGKLVGPKVRKGKWVWDSLTASPEQIVQAEYETGCDMAAALSRDLPPDENSEITTLVSGVGGRLAGRLTDRSRRWAFQAVQSTSANAFALPGGFIFVTRALVELCRGDPDELAFILGHEMGHVVHKHAFDRLVSSTLLTAASVASPLGRLATPRVVQIGTRLMQSAYTRDQELDADTFGLQLARSAGFDAAGGIRTMQRLNAAHGDQVPELLEWFSTHPPFPARIANLRRLLAKQK